MDKQQVLQTTATFLLTPAGLSLLAMVLAIIASPFMWIYNRVSGSNIVVNDRSLLVTTTVRGIALGLGKVASGEASNWQDVAKAYLRLASPDLLNKVLKGKSDPTAWLDDFLAALHEQMTNPLIPNPEGTGASPASATVTLSAPAIPAALPASAADSGPSHQDFVDMIVNAAKTGQISLPPGTLLSRGVDLTMAAKSMGSAADAPSASSASPATPGTAKPVDGAPSAS